MRSEVLLGKSSNHPGSEEAHGTFETSISTNQGDKLKGVSLRLESLRTQQYLNIEQWLDTIAKLWQGHFITCCLSAMKFKLDKRIPTLILYLWILVVGQVKGIFLDEPGD